MKRLPGRWSWVLLVLAVFMAGEPTAGAHLRHIYGSVPKGLLLEGKAKGFGKIEIVSYDPGKHRFILNRQEYYPIPTGVSREDLASLLEGLSKDDRLGVTYMPGGEVKLYGAVKRTSPLLQDLAKADRFLVSVVFGWRKNLRGIPLPGGWVPLENPNRKQPLICVTVFRDYIFSRSEGSYYRTNVGMSNLLIPMSEKLSGDGGYKEGEGPANPEGTDLENLEYLKAHASEFVKIPLIQKAVVIGEVAAFARFLRDNGKLNLKELAVHVRKAS